MKIRTVGRPKKELSREELKQVMTRYTLADKHGKKEVLLEIGMSQPTLWRRASEAGLIKSVSVSFE